jgi:hypothetical protein
MPEIIPALAKERAKNFGLPVNRYLENLVEEDAGKSRGLGEPIHDEAAMSARIGGAITDALTALAVPNIERASTHLLFAKRILFERLKDLQPHLAEQAQIRSQTRWREAGGVGVIPVYVENGE